ncbi:Integrase catalytic region, partial [mine drainage metagenome]
EIARPFEELAAHYEMAVIPARSKKPKDKAKVENEVGHVERSILAALRHRQFFSLEELNKDILKRLEILNTTAFQKRPESRKSLWEEEKASLQPLPQSRYEYGLWKWVKVHPDSHIDFERHFYSVPCEYVHQKVELRATAHVVEIFHQGKRIASHQRSLLPGGFTTVIEHLPASQQAYTAQQTPEYYLEKGLAIGPCMEELMLSIMAKRKYKEQAFRSCLGILSLEKSYGKERLETAAKRALLLGSFSYKSIKSILDKGLDQLPYLLPLLHEPILHENLRGATYYDEQEEIR